MEYIVLAVLIFIVVTLLIKVNKIEKRLVRVQFILEQVIKKYNLDSESPEHPIHDKLRKLISDGEEDEAVNIARETLGLSYQESHHHIKYLKSKMSGKS